MARLAYDPSVDRMTLEGEQLHCGQMLEVIDQQGNWTVDRLEYDDCGMWYLVYTGYRAAGLIGVAARFADNFYD